MSLKATLHFWIAQFLAFFKLYEGAIAQYRIVAGLHPRDPRAWRCIAFLLAEQGEHGQALPVFHAALRLDEGNAATRFNLAYTLHQQRLYQEAIAEFEKVVVASPRQDRAWYGMALCRSELGDLAGSAEALKEASQLQYFNAEAGYRLAVAYHRLGRHEEARTEYQRVKSFDPKAADRIRKETGLA
jgi:tetratricopeptide (TPR) repeat protein